MEMETDRPTLKDHILHVFLLLLTVFVIWSCTVRCSVLDDIEVCMEHPRYGQVCVKLVGGKVTRITAAAGDIEDPDVISWAQERVK